MINIIFQQTYSFCKLFELGIMEDNILRENIFCKIFFLRI
ncbi:hypothetical protein BMW23_0502 [Bodo saltans virus]|uniref:Uncharacterized protein n=1 Tax=Bodo saltans virus TaxID=2024608 RepID=A0A2H4UUE8_9VIRU|nr:hypothetical protein QJ851_gp0487 [Bodo saltans virus]ATZ80550.1 hypothetical protein BMW23_0502 [Bodo saltans virus]